MKWFDMSDPKCTLGPGAHEKAQCSAEMKLLRCFFTQNVSHLFWQNQLDVEKTQRRICWYLFSGTDQSKEGKNRSWNIVAGREVAYPQRAVAGGQKLTQHDQKLDVSLFNDGKMSITPTQDRNVRYAH